MAKFAINASGNIWWPSFSGGTTDPGKNITGYQRDLMKIRADHATSLHCDIFTIITNKHSSHKILSQTQLWSGPMRALVTQALCLHISSYECSHCPDHDWVWQQRGCVISLHSVDNRLCSCQQIDYKNFTKFTTKFGDSWNCVSFWHKICH